MTTETESTAQTVMTLRAELEAMGLNFRDYMTATSAKINKLQALLREANQAMVEDGDAIKADGVQLLEDFEASMSFAAGQVATTTTMTVTTQASRQSQVQSSRKTRGKKKVKDSGIGIEEDESLLPA